MTIRRYTKRGLKDKKTIPVFFAVIISVFLGNAEADGGSDIHVASTGLEGVSKVGIPTSSSLQLNLAGTAGYGVTESIGAEDGHHHRFSGRLAVGAHVTPWLALALNFSGRLDRHPRDEQGVDYSGTGEPRLLLRAGGALTKLLHLGGEIELWVPGREAPSMEWSGATVDFKLFPAFMPDDGSWFVGLLAGFRLDNSAKAAPALDRLRFGDRIALGLSDYNSVLLGLAGTYRWGRTELLAELSWDILVGDGAPAPVQSPLRANLGARHTIVDNLFAELLTEVALSKRPDVGQDDPLVPIEPRFSVSLGLRYVFDFQPEEETLVEPEPLTEAPPSPAATATVSGRLADPAGTPVPDVAVSLELEDGTTRSAITDALGGFVFEGVPMGSARLTAGGPGFEEEQWDILVGEEPLDLGQRTLQPVEAPPSSQLRGLVRSFSGKKIPAKVLVEPLGAELTCDEDGTFQLDVPPGKYTVTVTAPGFAKQTRTVKVEENGVSILNIDLRRNKGRRR